MFDASNDSATSRRTLMACIHLVAYSSCAVNPVVYCLLNERFKARVKKLAATVKLWGSGGGVGDRLVSVAGRSRVAVVAGPALRLGLLLTRDVAMSVDIPGRTVASVTATQVVASGDQQ